MQNADAILSDIEALIQNINTQNDSKDFRALKYDVLPEYLQKNIGKYKELISLTPKEKLCDIKELILNNKINYKPLEKIFSVKNSRFYKVVTVLGLRFAFKK